MQIFVKTMISDNILEFNMEPTDTIEHLKAKIISLNVVPSNHTQLIYDGEILDDTKTIAQCKIKINKLLYLINSLPASCSPTLPTLVSTAP